MYEDFDFVRDDLLARIDGGERASLSIKIRTFLTMFGYTANQRVRQSSLDAVLEMVDAWGIAWHFPRGTRADDYVTLYRADPADEPASAVEPVGTKSADVTGGSPSLHSLTDPLTFVFDADDQLDRAHSAGRIHDLLGAVWRSEPVCLFVDAADEFFTLAAGVLAAVMRRRALMFRTRFYAPPLAPEVLSTGALRALQGRSGEQQLWSMPSVGAVYLIRDEPDDSTDDELAAFVREALIPHTYRLRARFTSTVPVHGLGGKAASEDAEFDAVQSWLAAFAGSPELAGAMSVADQAEVQLASLLADASQIREAALARGALETTDAGFRAGYESSEHMLIKGAVLRHLRAQYGDAVQVESSYEPADTLESDEEQPPPDSRKSRPDLKVGRELIVEVETLRGIARSGSDPFVALEDKLRTKLQALQSVARVWLLVPADVAMLGHQQLSALVRNLDADRIELGFWDATRHEPVFLELVEPPELKQRLHGTSWRVRKPPTSRPQLGWDDVAGYGALCLRLQRDVVAPFVDARRYREFGLEPPGGVLLYGLPGCGKSHLGRVMAGHAELASRLLVPSDFTSMWLGEGVEKIREIFDWARRRSPSVLVIDEIDAIASVRREHNMHSDEKRQVNELLAQLERANDHGVLVVATTNYVRGVDPAIRRAGRFDFKIPVFPPDAGDRARILGFYLKQLSGFSVAQISEADVARLAASLYLYTPADIKHVVQTAARRALAVSERPAVTLDVLAAVAREHPRSIRHDQAHKWLDEARLELGAEHRGVVAFANELDMLGEHLR